MRLIFPRIPKHALYKYMRQGKIKKNNKKVKIDDKTALGDIFSFHLAKEVIESFEVPRKVKIDYKKIRSTKFYKKNVSIIYEDEFLLAVNKPSGVPVHSGTKHYRGNTMADLLHAYGDKIQSKFPPTLVHRLDLETSGVLLFAKNPEILRQVNKQIHDRKVEKKYVALCIGNVKQESLVIRTPLQRTHGRKKSTKIIIKNDVNSKMAVSHFRVRKHFEDIATLVDLRIETGRMHQIRVQMKSLGHPIIGDKHYGDFAVNRKFQKEPYNNGRMLLHSSFLSFLHPATKKKLNIEAEIPEDFQSVIKCLHSL